MFFDEGAMIEQVACCLHRIDVCEINPGKKVVVIDGGMRGLLMLQLAKLADSSKVALLEPLESNKREVVKKLGVDICINPINGKNSEEMGLCNKQIYLLSF